LPILLVNFQSITVYRSLRIIFQADVKATFLFANKRPDLNRLAEPSLQVVAASTLKELA
jgi:hypothetical protein